MYLQGGEKNSKKFIIQQKSWINSESIRGNGTQFKSTLKSKENEIKFKWEFKMKTKKILIKF